MRNRIASITVVISAAFLAPQMANASFVLDTGSPTGTGGPVVLSTAQFLAGEFSATAGQDITSLAAYLTQGNGQPGDSFTFDIYSASGFTSRPNSRPAPVLSATGTFTANGWNATSVNWVAPTTGLYWLALQVGSTTNTKGLDAPVETSATTGSIPALAFAYAAGSSGSYTSAGASPIGLQVTAASPVPLPAAVWLLGSGFAGLMGVARRRKAVQA